MQDLVLGIKICRESKSRKVGNSMKKIFVALLLMLGMISCGSKSAGNATKEKKLVVGTDGVFHHLGIWKMEKL